MLIDATKLEQLFGDCVWTPADIENNSADFLMQQSIVVEGLTMKIGFNPEKIKEHEAEITELLRRLPEQFYVGTAGGGGWSFLNFPFDKEGHQWGEHRNAEQLICLGIAIRKVKFLMPRELWDSFPGGVPYVAINLDGFKDEPQDIDP